MLYFKNNVKIYRIIHVIYVYLSIYYLFGMFILYQDGLMLLRRRCQRPEVILGIKIFSEYFSFLSIFFYVLLRIFYIKNVGKCVMLFCPTFNVTILKSLNVYTNYVFYTYNIHVRQIMCTRILC